MDPGAKLQLGPTPLLFMAVNHRLPVPLICTTGNVSSEVISGVVRNLISVSEWVNAGIRLKLFNTSRHRNMAVVVLQSKMLQTLWVNPVLMWWSQNTQWLSEITGDDISGVLPFLHHLIQTTITFSSYISPLQSFWPRHLGSSLAADPQSLN